MKQPLLELNEVHVAYLKKEILRDVSLTICEGEILAIVGENGAGKSTLLKVISGLLRCSQGTMRYRGQNLDGLSIEERQRLGIGYLMQGGRVFPNLTVRENFDLAAAGTRRKRGDTSQIGEWFPILRERVRARAGLLSGGQRQMLAIELILAQKPHLILFDEPTAAISVEVAASFLPRIREYILNSSAAMILVEQNVELALSVSDRSVVLKNANLGERADHNATKQ